MVTSDEPGYYEDGKFGIRLETDLEVVEADTAVNYEINQIFLSFFIFVYSTLSIISEKENTLNSTR